MDLAEKKELGMQLECWELCHNELWTQVKKCVIASYTPKDKWQCNVYQINADPTAFPYGNGMVLHFYQQQESSTTKTVHKVINKGLKAYV